MGIYSSKYINEANMKDIGHLEKSDIVLNFDKWSKSGDNILYITGLSGGGKSTISKELVKLYKAQIIQLDYVTLISMEQYTQEKRERIYNKLKEDCPNAAKYFNGDYNKIYGNWQSHEVLTNAKDFINWFDDNFHDDGNLYIIEGSHLFRIFSAEWFTTVPCIIKGTTITKSLWRRSYRELEKHIVDDGIFEAFHKFLYAFSIFFNKGYMNQVDLFNKTISSIRRFKKLDDE